MGTARKSYSPQTEIRTQIQAAVDVLVKGGVVAIPTDTLYGLAASARDDRACRRVYQIKGRQANMAIPVLIADSEEMDLYATDIPAIAWRLASSFFPGPLTIVLKNAGVLSPFISGGKETIALRVPAHDVPRSIVRTLGGPITGTSANLSGSPGLATAKTVKEHLGEEIDYIVDNGSSASGIQSTVIDLTEGLPMILREGAVPLRDIETVCSRKIDIIHHASS